MKMKIKITFFFLIIYLNNFSQNNNVYTLGRLYLHFDDWLIWNNWDKEGKANINLDSNKITVNYKNNFIFNNKFTL